MSRRDLIAIYFLTLLARVVVAAFQVQPGYMDAFSPPVGAQRGAEGYGFTEPYVWNYLDDPSSLPHPSHLYWMPMPSIVGALPMAGFGPTFRAAQAPFVLLSATLPPIAYAIAWRATSQRRAAAFAAGVCAGLAHLSRADGLLLLIPVMLNAELRKQNVELRMQNERKSFLHSAFCILHSSIIVLLGYLVVMLPWFLRNLAVIGMPLSTAGTQSPWLCDYDELFSFGVPPD